MARSNTYCSYGNSNSSNSFKHEGSRMITFILIYSILAITYQCGSQGFRELMDLIWFMIAWIGAVCLIFTI